MFANTFTSIHTILSLVAIVAGMGVMAMLINDRKPNAGTLIFLITAIATSVTGFFFPFTKFLPSHGVGVICLVLFVPALLAQYRYNFAGPWRWVYVLSMAVNVYFLFFVLVAQLFNKVPSLNALAPTQSEPPFAIAQLTLLAIFIWLTWRSVKNFRGPAAAA